MPLLCLEFQLFHAIGMRDKNKSIFSMNHLENPFMILAFCLGLALQLMVTEIPCFVQAPLEPCA